MEHKSLNSLISSNNLSEVSFEISEDDKGKRVKSIKVTKEVKEEIPQKKDDKISEIISVLSNKTLINTLREVDNFLLNEAD